MKKIVLGIIVAFLVLGGIPNALAENAPLYHKNKFVLQGYVVSNISASDLISKYNNVLPGLEKVDNAEQLKEEEYTDNANDIPLFAKVNLFSYEITGRREQHLSDINSLYRSLPFEDYYGRENIISAVNSLYQPNGIVTPYVTKTPSLIRITYKKISAGKKTSYIPVRNIVKTNDLTTHFLLVPYAKPSNERINKFDFAYTYDINPCFTATLCERRHSENKTADFTGFFTDIPEIPDDNYLNIVEKSLKKFSSYVHDANKLLIVENLFGDDYELGKYGDIIGISYPKSDANDFLEKVRRAFPDKIIFASINADLSDKNSLTVILQNLARYGIYPEFVRDTSTGDFFYYEKSFADSSDLINRYTKIIETENGFKFSGQFKYKDFKISKFVNNGSILYAVSGTGDFLYPVSGNTVTDLFGNRISVFDENGKTYVRSKVNGFKLLLVENNNSSNVLLLGMIPRTSSGTVSFVFKNLADKKVVIPVTVTDGSVTFYRDNMSFLPLSAKLLTVKYGRRPIKVLFSGINYMFGVPRKQFSVSGFILFIILLALFLLCLFIKKKRPLKKIFDAKKFVTAVFILPVISVILNRYFIHYSLHTITFFVFSLMYLLLAFYDTDFQVQAIFAFALMLFLGLIFNYLEFHTLLPRFFDGILPFSRYYIIIYVIPFVFSVLFFGMFGNAKLNKMELVVFILSIAGPAFLYDPLLSPFVTGLNVSSFYPILIPLIGGGLLGVFHKKGFAAYLIVFLLFSGIIVLGIYSSLRFYDLITLFPDRTRTLLIMKDVFLFSLPFYFFLLLHHNIVKKNPRVSLNKYVSIFFLLIVFAAYLSQWGIKSLGSGVIERFLALPLYILVVFLMSIILIEPINKKNTV